MPKYAYEVVTQAGEAISNEIVAYSVSEAIRILEQRGWTIQSIRALTEAQAEQLPDKSAFVERLDASLAQRATLIPALEALADELSNGRSGSELRQLIAKLKQGASARDLIAHPSAASWLPPLIRGVATDIHGDGFLRFISDAARESDNRNQRRRSLIYPLVLASICLGLITILLVTIVPTFGKMYQEFGLTLPGPTALVVNLSEQLRAHPLRSLAVFLLSVLAVIFAVRLWRNYALTNRLFGALVAGSTSNIVAIARFSSALADLLSLEAPLPQALRIAGRATQHYYYQRVAELLAATAAHDRPLEASPVAHNLPANVLRALHVGPGGAPSLPLLQELATLYSERAQQRLDWSSQVIGPLSIMAIGAVVGFVVIALFMPLVSMITSLT